MPNEDIPFVPTTNIYDIENIQDIDIHSPEFIDLLVRLRQNINFISILLNQKTAGNFPLTEFPTGQIYFPNPNLYSSTDQTPIERSVYRKVVNFGALPNTGTTNVAHDIVFPTGTNTFTFTKIYGCATDLATSYIPIPYASPTLVNNIELSADTTNVSITTGSNRTAYTTTYVVLEYIKS